MNEPKPLTIKPQGETHEWTFSTGHWCGQAADSVGIEIRGLGCVLTRQDVQTLRKWLQQAEESFINPPRRMGL